MADVLDGSKLNVIEALSKELDIYKHNKGIVELSRRKYINRDEEAKINKATKYLVTVNKCIELLEVAMGVVENHEYEIDVMNRLLKEEHIENVALLGGEKNEK